MEGPNEQLQTPEQARQNLAEKVSVELEKYKGQITQFNLLTISSNAGGFFETNTETKPVQYDERYKKEFELYNLEGYELMNSAKTGYIYDMGTNKATFQGYLGRSLGDGKRDGNGLFITLKFEKGFNPKFLIQSIAQLMDTIVAYGGNDKREDKIVDQDIKNIAKEGIQVLEAFKNIAEKFPSNGRISVQSIIDEYKDILNKHN